MQGAKDLVASERGWFCLALLLAATVLAVMKILTGADWISLAKWLGMTLVAGKSVTSAIETWVKPPEAVTPPTAQS